MENAKCMAPNKSRLDPFLDFCDHYQRVFLRRGLLIYCGMLLRSIEANAKLSHEEGEIKP